MAEDKSLAIDAAPKMFSVQEKPEWKSGSSLDNAACDPDLEKRSVENGTTVQLKRRLQSRHLQMIAIGMLGILFC